MTLKSILTTSAILGALTSPAWAQTEITFWHAMGGSLGETVNQMATDFNASQSDYVITPVFKGTYEETLTAGIAAFRAGEQPNIMQVFDAGAATVIAAQGAVVPVEELLTEYGSGFNSEDYISGVRNFYADTEGMMIGMPFNSSTPVMYYNQDALDAAGVPVPSTWEEFQEVTAPALKDAGFTALSASLLPWTMTENFYSRHNIQFATNENGYGDGTTEILIDQPEIRAHFTAMQGWVEDGYYEYFGAGWGDNQNPFEEGDVAMWLGSSGSFGGLLQTADFNFSSTFLPYWEGINAEPTQTFIGGAALFAMSGKSDEENAATAAFFEYLTSADVQYGWHRDTGYVPVTEAAYQLALDDGYYEEKPTAQVGVQQLQLPAGEWTRGYRMGFYVQVRDVMQREYGRILAGETTVEEAFQAIQAEADDLLDRFARTQG